MDKGITKTAFFRNRFVCKLALFATAIYTSGITAAYAVPNTPMALVLCSIIDILAGNLGRGLAVLAIIAVGIGAALGKASWGLALTVAIGIAVIFGAGKLVLVFTGILVKCP